MAILQRFYLDASGQPIREETLYEDGVVVAIANEMPGSGTEISGGQYDAALQVIAIEQAQTEADAATAALALTAERAAARAAAVLELEGLGLSVGVIDTILGVP